jgi:hypothetical protein
MTTLLINFFAEGISDELKGEFMNAVEHVTAEMNISLANSNIEALNKKIENKNNKYTEAQIEGFKDQLGAIEGDKADFEKACNDTLEVYTKVVNAMTEKDKDGKHNNKDSVNNVLRVLGSWNNSQLVKYAITPAFTSPELYQALETIHVNSKANEDGNISMTKAVKDAYKAASAELESIVKKTFSLPVGTEYTEKTRVKLTAEDKKLLNDCYIKGFSNKFDIDDETGVVSFKKRNLNKLVKEKKDKKSGAVTYDYSGLASTISNIVIKHYFVA